MKFLFASAISFIATFCVVTNAWYQQQQFYPTVVYLTKSSPSIAILYIQAAVLAYTCGKIMISMFFGTLRQQEYDNFYERCWYTLTDTCLAFTMFREQLDPSFVACFSFLLFVKSFHWLLEDRVDYMERSPNITLLFNIRVITLEVLLALSDMALIYFSYSKTVSNNNSVHLVFGFEYAVLLILLVSIFLKYCLHLIDIQNENPWENKAMYMIYVELFSALFRCILYLAFITIVTKVVSFPLFCIRPMYLSIRRFKNCVRDIVLSRRAIKNMNTLYPDATAEDLEAISDITCIICREDMVLPDENDPTAPTGTLKKLPCGHIFHTACLRSWFQRQQTCPTCRFDILQSTATSQTTQPAANNNNQNRDNQQQPAPQQQNQQPPANPQLFNQFANFFPPPPVPPQMLQQPAAANGNQQPSSPAPQFIIPPHHMFPFMPPPPPSPPTSSLDHLSDEDLRKMEGDEREAVERRIRHLRQIQTLIDAAQHNFMHYQNVVSRNNTAHKNEATSCSSDVQNKTNTGDSTSDLKQDCEPTTSSDGITVPQKPTNTDVPPEYFEKEKEKNFDTNSMESVHQKNEVQEFHAENEDCSEDTIPSCKNELRQRRLAHLNSKKSDT